MPTTSLEKRAWREEWGTRWVKLDPYDALDRCVRCGAFTDDACDAYCEHLDHLEAQRRLYLTITAANRRFIKTTAAE